MRNGEWVLKTSKSPKTETNFGGEIAQATGKSFVLLSRGTYIPEFVERLVLKSRTETDARKKDSVIFVLISRTNLSRNFVPQTPLRPLSTKFFKLQQFSSN
jgi:hypothetical protein